MSAREEILGRVRAAVGERPQEPVPREYVTRLDADIDTFIARLEHYQARPRRVHEGGVAEAVSQTLAQRGATRVVVPGGIPEAWLAGLEPLRDEPPLSAHELDGCDGVLSTCAVAIAETGTIVLDAGPGMGRRVLSLVPDYHLCIVRSEQLVGSLPEAIAKLDPLAPLTFISGPSATVDIELVRVGGVHGPRTLDVIIVESS